MAIIVWNVKLKSFQASLVQDIQWSVGTSKGIALCSSFANISQSCCLLIILKSRTSGKSVLLQHFWVFS